MYFRDVDFKQSLDQIHFAKLINYEIDENVFLLSKSMRNVVIEDEFSFFRTIGKKIYINHSKTRRMMELNYHCH